MAARETPIVIRGLIVDGGLDLGEPDGVEVRTLTGALDPGPWAPHEVLLVSADPERLAAAGALGLNRLVAADAQTTAAAVAELCGELDRP
jgi:hypothetical protein